MNRFITIKELKGIIFIPLLFFFFYVITETILYIAAFEFMYTNNFTESEIDDALVNSTILITISLIIITFYNTLTGYFVARYLKVNLIKISILTIISLELINSIVLYFLPKDDLTKPVWQDFLYYGISWTAVLFGTWLVSHRLQKINTP